MIIKFKSYLNNLNTYLVWPMRWTLPMACNSSPGLSNGSTNITWVASIRFKPFAPKFIGSSNAVTPRDSSCNEFMNQHEFEKWNIFTLNSWRIFSKLWRCKISLLTPFESITSCKTFNITVQWENTNTFTFSSFCFNRLTNLTTASTLVEWFPVIFISSSQSSALFACLSVCNSEISAINCSERHIEQLIYRLTVCN